MDDCHFGYKCKSLKKTLTSTYTIVYIVTFTFSSEASVTTARLVHPTFPGLASRKIPKVSIIIWARDWTAWRVLKHLPIFRKICNFSQNLKIVSTKTLAFRAYRTLNALKISTHISAVNMFMLTKLKISIYGCRRRESAGYKRCTWQGRCCKSCQTLLHTSIMIRTVLQSCQTLPHTSIMIRTVLQSCQTLPHTSVMMKTARLGTCTA